MKKMNTKEFIVRANKIHDNKYNYECSVYSGALSDIKIMCPDHGEFVQIANNHISGRGCRACGIMSQKKSTNDFIKNSNNIHGNKYDYSFVKYSNAHTKVNILCKEHGGFKQSPNNHLSGKGCPKCSVYYSGKTLHQFIKEANKIHSYKYNYTKSIYKGSFTKIIITCSKHGDFKTAPSTHLGGSECPKCSNSNISKIENEYFQSLNNLNIIRNKPLTINKRTFIPDGYDPTTNTIYEFNGDYWHGNPDVFDPNEINMTNKKTFGQLYATTLEKEKAYKKAGYNVMSIWEADYKSNRGKRDE